MSITVEKDYEKSPAIFCPHCKKELHLTLEGFKPDITKIVKSNCVHCGGVIFAGLMLITDISLQNLVGVVANISKLFDKEMVKFVDGSGKSLH